MAGTANMHITVYGRILGDFPAKNTAYTIPFVYDHFGN